MNINTRITRIREMERQSALFLFMCIIVPLSVIGLPLKEASCQAQPATNEPADTAIVGSNVGKNDPAATELKPNLIQDGLPAAKSGSPLPSQMGNANPIQRLSVKRSDQIESSISGVALIHGSDFFDSSPEVKGQEWGPYWLIDGDKDIAARNVTYSSGLHQNEATNEWVQVDLAESRSINKVVLYPRTGGTHFPLDFQILLSKDGKTWETVVEKKNYANINDNAPQTFTFAPTVCKSIRVLATKLKPEREAEYYLQLQEMQAFSPNSAVNWALSAQGAKASAGNPLTGHQDFDYHSYYANMFESGSKWLFVSDDRALSNYRQKKGNGGVALVDNLKHVRRNGMNVIYRFSFPSNADLKADEKKATQEYVEAIAPVITRLKGQVAVWVIGNEQNFGPRAEFGVNDLPKVYARVVAQAAERIRAIDPGAKIEIETALFDFGWTKAVFDTGLGKYIDQVGVHVYKELTRPLVMPETVGTFIENGVRRFSRDQPYKTYQEEVEAYKKLITSYNPAMKLWITETSVNTGPGDYNVSVDSQVKFLARLYTQNYILDVGPTMWWGLDPAKTGTTGWGLIDMNGKRKPAWYALQNVSSTIDSTYTQKNASEYISVKGGRPELIYALFEKKNGEYLIPYWNAVPMRDGNTGASLDFVIKGIEIQNAHAVDTLTGTEHKLDFVKRADNSYTFTGLIARDYPIFIRIDSRR